MTKDLKISGSGTIFAGEYDTIGISGGALIDGDITFDTLKVSGGCHTNAPCILKGTALRISGSLKASGELQVEDCHISGSCKLTDCEVHGNTLHVSGSLTTNRNIKVKELKSSGSIKSNDAKIYADSILISGSFVNNDEINADDIELYGSSTLNDVFGEHVRIGIAPKNCHVLSFRLFSSEKRPVHHVKNIECTQLEAASLHCESISAETIELSKYSVVDHIQCDGSLVYDSTCKIGTVEGTCTQSVKE